MKLTLEELVEKAKIIHNDQYDYSKVCNSILTHKNTIICHEHGEFEQSFHYHLKRSGCYKCAMKKEGQKRVAVAAAKFIKKAVAKYPQFDFSESVYLSCRHKVRVKCHKHGYFKILPANVIKGIYCCPKCQSKRINLNTSKKNFEKCKKVHGDLYDYSKYDLTKHTLKNQIVTCRIHGDFNILVYNHIKGSGCPACAQIRSNEFNRQNSCGWDITSWERQSKKSKTFDSFKVYVLICESSDEIFFKIGRTFNKVKKRFSCKIDMPYDFHIYKIFEYETAKEAFYSEVELKRLNKENKYSPKLYFGGREECFSDIKLK